MWHVACGLAFAAFELARRGWTIHEGHLERPALWWSIIANSAEGKGQAISLLRDVVQQYEEKARNQGVIDDSTLGEQSAILDFRGTPEGLSATLEQREYRIGGAPPRTVGLLVHDELREILLRAKKHDYFTGDLIDCWDQRNEVRRYQLNTRKSKFNTDTRKGVLLRPALSTLFASTEDRLHGLLDREQLAGGFSSRMLWLTTPKGWQHPGLKDPRWYELNSYKGARLVPIVRSLMEWSLALLGGGTIVYTAATHALHMQTAHAFALEHQHDGPILKALLGRRSTQILMIAAVLAGVGRTDSSTIRTILVQPPHYEAAVRLYAHVERAMVYLCHMSVRSVWHVLEDQPNGMTVRDIAIALDGKHVETAREVEALVRDREILRMQLHTGKRGAPPTLYYHRDFAPALFAVVGESTRITPEQRESVARDYAKNSK
jgi:hypothetical protein